MELTKQERNKGIVALYKSGKYTTEYIAKHYGITTKSVQRICKQAGVLRTQAESNKLMAPLKNYKTIPIEYRVQRKHLPHKLRYKLISEHPYCINCGMKPSDGIRLEIDHIDNNPSNNVLSNLQVLCAICNRGKSDVNRFGV